jgi:hypothetical protein
MPFPGMGIHPAHAFGLGMQAQPWTQMGIPSAPYPSAAGQISPAPVAWTQPLPYTLFGFQQATVPTLGIPQVAPHFLGAPQLPFQALGVHPAQAPGLGLQAAQWPVTGMGIHPAQALGFGLQAGQWPITGFGGPGVSPLTAMLLTQFGLKEAVSRITDEPLKERIINGINEAINRSIEGLAGMTLHPWFGPGAQAMIYPVVSELALVAHTMQDGAVRNELLNLAGQILNKSIAPTGEGAGGGRRH